MTKTHESLESEGPLSDTAASEQQHDETERTVELEQSAAAQQDEDESHRGWKVIKPFVRHSSNLADPDLVVNHGVHQTRRLCQTSSLCQAIFNSVAQEYVTIDGKTIRRFSADGKETAVRRGFGGFSRLVFASHVNLFVGWTPGATELVLNTHELNVSSVASAQDPVLTAAYNENAGEVITVGSQEATVLNLYNGKLLEVKKGLHVRSITAVLFFNPLKYLLTAGKDGSIKVWDPSWRLQLVFVGHDRAVTSLAMFPYGPMVMSASLDCTMRVWSFETCDEVDLVLTTGPVRTLLTNGSRDEFLSVSDGSVDLWKIQHVHTLHTRVGYQVAKLQTTDHSQFPKRCVLLCDDSSVRIVNPVSGSVITTLLADQQRGLVDAAYAIEMDTLFAVYSNGDVVKSDTTKNPCQVVAEWKCVDSQQSYSCVLVYEYVLSEELKSDSVSSMKRAILTKGLGFTTAGSSANRNLLLGGRRDGCLCVLNMRTGKTDFQMLAHGPKGVVTLVSYASNDQVLSSGFDHTIRTWRVFPYAVEALAPLRSIYCGQLPVLLTILEDKLGVVFQNHDTATYGLIMHNLIRERRYDHSPKDDHLDTVTGLSSCPVMRLVATSSDDNTVRVWDEKNRLVRIIKLNARPHSLSFCSDKGDLLVGIGRHLHIIDHKRYMPESYAFRLLATPFAEPTVERALPFEAEVLEMLPPEDAARLKAAQSAVSDVHGWCQESDNFDKFAHFVDVLTDEEMEEKKRQEKAREHVFSRLTERDRELARLRNSKASGTRKIKSTPQTRGEAFERYMKLFYNRSETRMPQENDYPGDTLENVPGGPPVQRGGEGEYRPEKEPLGFFQPAEWYLSEQEDGSRPIYYVPNSVLARLLWPQDELVKEKEEERYRPPQLTEKQLEQISAWSKEHQPTQRRQSDNWDRVLLVDWSTEDEDDLRALQRVKRPVPVEQKVQKILAKVPTPSSQRIWGRRSSSPRPVKQLKVVNAMLTKSLDWVRLHIEMPLPMTYVKPKCEEGEAEEQEAPAVQLETKALKEKRTLPLLTHPSKPAEESASPMKIPVSSASPPLASPSTPVASSPTESDEDALPNYISQFIGQAWFERTFPDASPETFPKPWTLEEFSNTLEHLVEEADFAEKEEIVRAISILHIDHGLPNPTSVEKVILSTLSPEDGTSPPSCERAEQKAFLLSALESLEVLGVVRDREFYAVLMTHFVEGDVDVKSAVLDVLGTCGLKDDFENLSTELDTWDAAWDMEPTQRHTRHKQMSRDALDTWMESFQSHIEDTVDKLRNGHDIRGVASKRRKPTSTSGGRASRRSNRASSREQLPSTDHLSKSPRKSNLKRIERSNRASSREAQNSGTARGKAMGQGPPPPLPSTDHLSRSPRKSNLKRIEETAAKEWELHHQTEATAATAAIALDSHGAMETKSFSPSLTKAAHTRCSAQSAVVQSANRDMSPSLKPLTEATVAIALDSHGALETESVAPNLAKATDMRRPAQSTVVQSDSRDKSPSLKPLTVAFGRAPDVARAKRVSYIEAINYYCEVQVAAAAARLRAESSMQPRRPDEGNTVLVLPKIAGSDTLARLGETHSSQCRPHRETVYSDLKLPPLPGRGSAPAPGDPEAPFPLCVRLPLNPILLSPFPDAGDALELLAQRPVHVTLCTAAMYFVPKRSCVPPTTAV